MKLRAGSVRLLLILALALFALIVGIGSAAVEIATITRVEVDSAVNRARLAGHIVASQIGITLHDSGQPITEAIRGDDRLATVLADAQELTPSVSYVMVTDTLDKVILHSDPVFEGRNASPAQALEVRKGLLANLRQGLSVLRETGTYEVLIPLLLDGRDFATVRVGISGVFLRHDLLNVFRTHLFKILVQVILATVLGSLVSWFIILQPLSRIEKGILHLQKGDFTYKLPEVAGNEFGQLAGQINALGEMLAREQENHATQRDNLVSEGNTLRSIVNAVDDGIIMVDRNRQIMMSNGRAASYLGVDFSAFTGKPLIQALSRNHPLVRLVDKSFADSRVESGQLELRTHHGSRVFLASSQVIGEAPHQQGAIVSLREFGRMKELQAMLDHARILSRLGKMAAGVAHEVRNPLNALVLHVELIRTKLLQGSMGPRNGNEKLQEHLNVVSREINRLERVVSGFLNLTRLQELEVAAIDVHAFLKDLHSLVLPEARMAGVDVELEVQDNLPAVYGDEGVLRQAFMNLLRNAIQASPRGSAPIRMCAEVTAGLVEITVADRGVGIPPDVQNKIFDLYYTTRKEGTGVGLAQAQQAIDMHSGTISFQSSPETGTLFRVRLPALTTVR